MLLAGKVALITGASTGIGAASARLFAREGASVVVSARSEDKLVGLVDDGLVGLSKTAASEYGSAGIRVNVVSPGVIQTPQTAPWLDSVPGERERVRAWNALKRLAQPEEVAEAAAWLLSDRASFVTGAELAVDGGCTAIAPYVG